MPFERRRRAVGEDVAEVAAAAGAGDFRALHPVTGVTDAVNVGLVERREEAGPAGAGVELGVGAEQRQPAQPAAIDAAALVVEEHAAERRLGAVVQQHALFLVAQGGDKRGALGGRGRGQVEARSWRRSGACMVVVAGVHLRAPRCSWLG